MSDAKANFLDHALNAKKYSSLNLSEADTRAYLIDPLLVILGYDGVQNLRREVTVPATRESVDYQLLIDGQPRAIVEAKALRHALTDQHAAQCVQYASVLGVRWCLITNGITWAVYDAHAKAPLEGKRVAEVRLDGDVSVIDEAWEILKSFSLGSLAQASPLTNLLVDRVVADELARPDSRAVEMLRREVGSRFGEKVSGQVVVNAIGRLHAKFTNDDSADSEQNETSRLESKRDDFLSDKKSLLDAGIKKKSPRRQPPDKGNNRVTVDDLIRAELLPSDAVLTSIAHGVTHVARLHDGQLEINGQLYGTPSAASKAVRNVRSWNGWIDWHYKGQSLRQLRDELKSITHSQIS